MSKVLINYGLDDDSLYLFENISKLWSQNLGLSEPEFTYHCYAQKVVKFHILLITLEKVSRSKVPVTLLEIMKSLTNDFVRMSVRLPVNSYQEPVGLSHLWNLKSYMMSHFSEIFTVSVDQVRIISKISTPSPKALKDFRNLVLYELKVQESRIPREISYIEGTGFGNFRNECIETVQQAQLQLARQYVPQFFRTFTNIQDPPEAQLKTVEVVRKRNPNKVYDPSRYQLTIQNAQIIENFQRPYGFDDETVERLLNGEDVPIKKEQKKGPLLPKMGDYAGGKIIKPSSRREINAATGLPSPSDLLKQ